MEPRAYLDGPHSTPPKWVNVWVAAPLPGSFTYEWPFDQAPQFGQRVVVPWGKQHRVALVHSAQHNPPESAGYAIKAVHRVLDDGQLLQGHWQALMEFAVGYYHHPAGMAALEALPKALRVLNAKGEEPVMVTKALGYALALPDEAKRTLPPTQFPQQHLTAEQTEVMRGLGDLKGFEVHLLHGITGSGKTEIYLQAIEQVLQRGQQALVLLPEINLTPAAQALYEQRLAPRRVVVLHSSLAELPRTKAWMMAATGKADVVIATRLGVFTPLPRLGLVVVDEEHDPSYKQQEGMKYNARDLAVVMGKQRQVPVVLGSATPSLETWWRAEQGQYKRLSLTRRAVLGATPPQVELVNMQNAPAVEGLSQTVMDALKATLEAGLQSIVFLNRRGFAPQLFCEACGWVGNCRHCTAHVVWHKQERLLRCHHCGANQPIPRHCPDCGNQDLKPLGRGTQRVEETLAHLLPQARIARMDADSTRNKGEAQALLDQAHAGEVDVLVGTQMIAKGHDFARVSLVVALNVDASLFSHSYRAPERLFAQLMQVAGRAGRRPVQCARGLEHKPRVLVQTRYPDHPLFEALIAHDYRRFAVAELQNRMDARMPPFSFQVLLRAEHKLLANALDFLRQAKAMGMSLLSEDSPVVFCDAVPLTIVRVANVERAQMVVESESRPALQRFLGVWLELLWGHKTPVKWQLEVDPAEL